jgi:hypothetical protein
MLCGVQEKTHIHRFITALVTLLSKTGAAKNNGTWHSRFPAICVHLSTELSLVDLANKSQWPTAPVVPSCRSSNSRRICLFTSNQKKYYLMDKISLKWCLAEHSYKSLGFHACILNSSHLHMWNIYHIRVIRLDVYVLCMHKDCSTVSSRLRKEEERHKCHMQMAK